MRLKVRTCKLPWLVSQLSVVLWLILIGVVLPCFWSRPWLVARLISMMSRRRRSFFRMICNLEEGEEFYFGWRSIDRSFLVERNANCYSGWYTKMENHMKSISRRLVYWVFVRTDFSPSSMFRRLILMSRQIMVFPHAEGEGEYSRNGFKESKYESSDKRPAVSITPEFVFFGVSCGSSHSCPCLCAIKIHIIWGIRRQIQLFYQGTPLLTLLERFFYSSEAWWNMRAHVSLSICHRRLFLFHNSFFDKSSKAHVIEDSDLTGSQYDTSMLRMCIVKIDVLAD